MYILALFLALLTPCQACDLIDICHSKPKASSITLFVQGDLTHNPNTHTLTLNVPQGRHSTFSYGVNGNAFQCTSQTAEDTAPVKTASELSPWRQATTNPLTDTAPQSYVHLVGPGMTSYTHTFYPSVPKGFPDFWDLFFSFSFQTRRPNAHPFETEGIWHFTPSKNHGTTLSFTSPDPQMTATVVFNLKKTTHIETSPDNDF